MALPRSTRSATAVRLRVRNRLLGRGRGRTRHGNSCYRTGDGRQQCDGQNYPSERVFHHMPPAAGALRRFRAGTTPRPWFHQRRVLFESERERRARTSSATVPNRLADRRQQMELRGVLWSRRSPQGLVCVTHLQITGVDGHPNTMSACPVRARAATQECANM